MCEGRLSSLWAIGLPVGRRERRGPAWNRWHTQQRISAGRRLKLALQAFCIEVASDVERRRSRPDLPPCSPFCLEADVADAVRAAQIDNRRVGLALAFAQRPCF